jgi:hypothetical protein
MSTRYAAICLWLVLFSVAPSLAADSAASGAVAAVPPHLSDAQSFVDSLVHARLNVYSSRNETLDFDLQHPAARCVCSGFIALLLKHSYGLRDDGIEYLFGAKHPEASDVYRAIVTGDHFDHFDGIDRVAPGDILAVQFVGPHSDTGHVMLVETKPVRAASAAPEIADTVQYRVGIIDATGSGHGPNDSRHVAGDLYSGGVGRGTIRLYVNSDGRIVGYAWSESPRAKYCTAPEKILVVGRLKPATVPSEPEAKSSTVRL